MLDDETREAARSAIESRFLLRDEQLDNQLAELASRASNLRTSDEFAQIDVRLRLACEHDLFERAHIVWNSLKRAHQDSRRRRSRGPELLMNCKDDLHVYMRDAAINLANRLAEHAAPLGPAFSGPNALDARWIGRLQRTAEERQARDMAAYCTR